MLTFEQVMELIRKENEYAAGWANGSRKVSTSEVLSDDAVHSGTTGWHGSPFSICDWMLFAKKYYDEAGQAMQNYTPDGGAVLIRLIGVISLLLSCTTLFRSRSGCCCAP